MLCFRPILRHRRIHWEEFSCMQNVVVLMLIWNDQNILCPYVLQWIQRNRNCVLINQRCFREVIASSVTKSLFLWRVPPSASRIPSNVEKEESVSLIDRIRKRSDEIDDSCGSDVRKMFSGCGDLTATEGV